MPTLTSARWQQVKAIFQQVAELPPGERTSVLAQIAAGDEVLGAEVAKLLAADEQAEEFLEASPVPEIKQATDDSAAGQTIGSYRLSRELGRGGMGTVYLAERDDAQFRQQVAIKIIRRGMDSEDILRRFRTERQILASLNHPNIARLLDGGSTAEGRPYYVMEYIEGRFIDDYCNEQQLSLADRLKLFRQACAAVHYAHQHLVIHRDLKPSNIMVTAAGEVKLLDFGIAKLLTPDDPHATLTNLGLMTPAYASPEQVRGETVTTAADVYALGVILYELLSGHSPYRVPSDTVSELTRAICEQEPLKPSVRAEGMRDEGGGMKAGSRKLFSSLIPHPSSLLRGDLDNIALMALRKDPARRYASVEQFSEDLRRYLDGLPVRARPDTFRYRAGKFVQRNRSLTGAVLLVLLTLLGGIAATVRQARIAEHERALAQQRFDDVRHLANDFVFKYHDAIAELPGSTAVRALLVRDATAYLDKLSQAASNDAGLQFELAQAYAKLGAVQGRRYDANVGDTAGALASFRKSQALLEGLRGQPAWQARTRDELLRLYHDLGDLLARSNQAGEALALQQKALALSQEALAAEPANPGYRLQLVNAQIKLGDATSSMRSASPNGQDRLDIYLSALPQAEELYRAEPRNPAVLNTLIRLNQRIGSCLSWQALGKMIRQDGLDGAPQQFRAALPYQRRVLELTDALTAEQTTAGSTAGVEAYLAKRNRVAALVNYGAALRHTGALGEALLWQFRALKLMEELCAHDSANREARSDLGDVEHEIALSYAAQGDARNTYKHHRLALAHKEAVAARDGKNQEVRTALKVFADEVARALRKQR
ncbi:MAG: serine/threonine protein kinase [Acidobacteria bacterium]|nr:serine/threonine protein kinase [Acidobacteriota bacterium]MBI3427157.1 serine/threonine protein kinase [Acidobacteriota bacterium]